MRKPSNRFTRLEKDLKQLRPGEILSHSVNMELRQSAYHIAQKFGFNLVIREMPMKKGMFEITKTK